MQAVPRADVFGLAGTTLDGKFAIHEIVDVGGASTVYRATQLALKRSVAIKVHQAPPDLSERARARYCQDFEREARTLAQLANPHIVQVIDFGVAQMPSGDRTPWMALEWLDGPSLATMIDRADPAVPNDPAGILALLAPVFEALACAHAAGIAHRDVKPANIVSASTTDGRRTLKLVDFGIAKPMGEGESVGTGLTHTTAVLVSFTIGYASPEQVGGSRTGPWTDVHAMGLIVCELLARRRVFDASDRAEVAAQVLAPVRPTPAALGIDAGSWEKPLARALAIRPPDRFANAREMFVALEESLSGASALPLSAAAIFSDAEPRPDTTPETDEMAIATTRDPRPHRSRSTALGIALGLPLAVVAGVLSALAVRHTPSAGTVAAPPHVSPPISTPPPAPLPVPTVVSPEPVAPSVPVVVEAPPEHATTRPSRPRRAVHPARPDRVRVRVD